jgi:hypothetical protein
VVVAVAPTVETVVRSVAMNMKILIIKCGLSTQF